MAIGCSGNCARGNNRVNQETLAKVTAGAAFVCSAEARKVEKYLADPYRLCLQIFATLSDGEPKTVQEIADLIPAQQRQGRQGNLPPAWNTINQILLALKKGGVEFIIGNGNPTARTWKLPKGKTFATSPRSRPRSTQNFR
jgi:hypothetical protein